MFWPGIYITLEVRMKKYLHLFRVPHYIKNLFVFAGVLFVPIPTVYEAIKPLLIVFSVFCLASSTIYIFNDLFDLEEDRLHPKKSIQPLASGLIKVKTAWFLFFLCLIFTGILCLFCSIIASLIILAYILLNIAYSVKLKKIVLIDVFIVASGYVLRILAGTLGVGIPPSHWFLLCTLSISLFLGFGKRRNELKILDDVAVKHRSVLRNYSLLFLDQMMTITATATLIFYSLYTIAPETIQQHDTENMMLTIPFVIFGLFRYMYLIYIREGGGDPTYEILTDRILQIDILAWICSILVITRFL